MRTISRRSFLMLGALAAGRCLFPRSAPAAVPAPRAREKSLTFCNQHTAEILETVYWKDGKYVPRALERINHIFRDRRTDEIHPIDTRLLDLLHLMKLRLKTDAPIDLVCGYRSPRTNAMLRRKSRGVAKRSFHLQGQAVDIRVPGFKPASLRRVAMAVHGGGVGYYPRAGFVHLDVGPVRSW